MVTRVLAGGGNAPAPVAAAVWVPISATAGSLQPTTPGLPPMTPGVPRGLTTPVTSVPFTPLMPQTPPMPGAPPAATPLGATVLGTAAGPQAGQVPGPDQGQRSSTKHRGRSSDPYNAEGAGQASICGDAVLGE